MTDSTYRPPRPATTSGAAGPPLAAGGVSRTDASPVTPTDRTPLYSVVDPDAHDALVGDAVRVTFELGVHHVTLGDGRVGVASTAETDL